MRKFMYILMVAALGASLTACSVNGTNSTDGGIKIPGSIISSDANSETNASNITVSSDLGNTNPGSNTPSREYDNVYPQHEPYGTGVGAMPGRVVWAHDPDSVEWDGNGYWWNTNNFDESVILTMVNDSIASLGGKATAAEGWKALFQAHNGGDGYRAGQKIAIKANFNGSAVFDNDTSGETKMSYTNPVLIKALLRSLVEEAGADPADITQPVYKPH